MGVTIQLYWGCAILVASLAVHGAARAQAESAPSISGDISEIRSLEEWDEGMGQLTKSVWQAHDSFAASSELGGDRVYAYWDNYLFLPATKHRLDELHAQAQKQSESGDEAGLKRTLAEASPLLSTEWHKSQVVLLLWKGFGRLLAHQRILERWLARVDPSERAQVQQSFTDGRDALMKWADATLQAGGFTSEIFLQFTVTQKAPLESLNRRRLRLVREQAGMPSPLALGSRARKGECPAAAAPLKGSATPNLDRGNFPSAEDYYPRSARWAFIEGPVVVQAQISDKGCVEVVEVVRDIRFA